MNASVRETRRTEGSPKPAAAYSEVVRRLEDLEVYRCSMEFVGITGQIAQQLRDGSFLLGEDLRRAALSIPKCIADGAGRTADLESKTCFGRARGSAIECREILEACRILHLAPEDRIRQGRAVLDRIVAMLTQMRA